MTKKLYITHAMLKKAGACPSQRELFCRQFPSRKVEITQVNALRYAGSFSTSFLNTFLPCSVQPAFSKVREGLVVAGLRTQEPAMRIALAAVFVRLVQQHGLVK